MSKNQDAEPKAVIGFLGDTVTIEDLPAPQTKRWVMRRKAEVICAVNGRLLRVEDALKRYNLTLEELHAWQDSYDRSGMRGLRVSYTQRYRELYKRRLR